MVMITLNSTPLSLWVVLRQAPAGTEAMAVADWPGPANVWIQSPELRHLAGKYRE